MGRTVRGDGSYLDNQVGNLRLPCSDSMPMISRYVISPARNKIGFGSSQPGGNLNTYITCRAKQP